MISSSSTTASILSGSSFIYKLRVESWLDDTLLDDDVPVTSAMEDSDRSIRVPERLTLVVPARARGVNYAPDVTASPLAANGQRLRVLLGVGARGDEVEWLQRGWFVVQESRPTGDVVNVTAAGMLSLIDEARLVSPYQPSGTLGSTLRGLLEPALTVDLSAAPTDRSVPSGINFDEDRLQAVLDLLDAWPATGAVNADGVFVVTPVTTPAASLAVSTSTTAIRINGGSTRDGAYSAVVARGIAADGGQVQGVAYDNTTGPKRYGGPFNPLAVPYFFSSPLLTTVSQCSSAATTIMARLQREGAQRQQVEMVPDPRIQLGDTLTADAGSVSVESLQLPYLPGGSMTLGVRVL